MKNYTILINQDALQDIRDATDWYNFKANGLGNEFKKQVISQISSLRKNPSIYAIRYADVRCLVIKNYPFLVHFTVDEANYLVNVFAVFHTSRNPLIWQGRL
ncbi:MAG: type II toxin-antitoxin system RelE/ParE family toxin [Emticicia sp.]|nr:type II toxin-antitoxin system RelE/ParE family toxin [Emticicia sp.]